jgi:hypothetical protein
MNKLATWLLSAGIAVTGLIALYAAIKAESAIFAFHMSLIVVWAIAFTIFVYYKVQSEG